MALTKRDLNLIREVVHEEIDRSFDNKLDGKLNEKLSGFITKDEFYKMADKILSELSDLRDEVTLSASHSSVEDLGERMTKIEHIHPEGKHPLSALA